MIINDTYVIEKPYKGGNVKLTEQGRGWGEKGLERFRGRVEMERVKADLRGVGEGRKGG